MKRFIQLNFAYKANKLVLDGDQLAIRYLTKLTGAVSVHVNSVVNINAAANRERERGGNPSIKLTMQHLMSEAVQHQKVVSLQTLGMTRNTSGSKGPTPIDLDVIQTTVATSADSISDKFDTPRAEFNAELNTFRTESRSRTNFQPRRKHMAQEKEPFKCYNCKVANHLVRHCTMPKKEAGKAQDQ
jgi:hypothetical protein